MSRVGTGSSGVGTETYTKGMGFPGMVTGTPCMGMGIFQGGSGTSMLGQGSSERQVPWYGDRDAQGGDRNPHSGDRTFSMGTGSSGVEMGTLSCA